LKLERINGFQQILEVKARTKKILEEYQFEHYTIETELDEETCNLV